MISEQLYRALRAWRREAYAPDPCHAVRVYGLCNWVADCDLGHELEQLLVAEFADSDYPFGGSYGVRNNAKDLHLNPLRRAWVDAKIKEYEDA